MGPDGEGHGAADLVAVGEAAGNPDPYPGPFEEEVAGQGGETHAADLAIGEALYAKSRSADEAGAGELDLLSMEGRTTRVDHESDDADEGAERVAVEPGQEQPGVNDGGKRVEGSPFWGRQIDDGHVTVYGGWGDEERSRTLRTRWELGGAGRGEIHSRFPYKHHALEPTFHSHPPADPC